MATIDQNFLLGVGSGILLAILISYIIYFLFKRSFILKNILKFVTFFIIVNSTIVIGVFYLADQSFIDKVIVGILISSAGPLIAWMYFLIFSDSSDLIKGFRGIRTQTAYLANKDLRVSNTELTGRHFKEIKEITSSLNKFRSDLVETMEVTKHITNEISDASSVVNGFSKDLVNYFSNMSLSKSSFDSIRDQASLTLENLNHVITTQQTKLQVSMNYIENKLKALNDLSDLTKIVAINAAIEASQSEIGSGGFNLVADDVTELSNRAVKATDDLKEDIREMYQIASTGIEEIGHNVQNLMSVLKSFMMSVDKMSMEVETKGGSVNALISTLQDLTRKSATLEKLFEDYKY